MKALAIAALASIVGFGCNKTEPDHKTEATTPQEQQSGAKPAAQKSTQSVAEAPDVKAALAAYETIRASLAQDKSDGVPEAATKLAGAARRAAEKVDGSASAQLSAMAKAAEQLKSKVNGDMAELRKSFGDLSRAVVALVSAHPELQKGLRIFECPMAEGYKKWVQTTESINNPYMGTKMPSCGSQIEWDQG